MKTKQSSSGNPQANATIHRIYQVLGNLVQTYNLDRIYVDDAYPCIGILVATAFVACSTYQKIKGKILSGLVFVRDMILPISHIGDCKYICQPKKEQIEKNIIGKKTTIIDGFRAN